MPSGPPNRAGFERGLDNTYFRIGLVLVILKVVSRIWDFGNNYF